MDNFWEPFRYVYVGVKYFFKGLITLLVSIYTHFITGFKYLFMTKKSLKENLSGFFLLLSLVIYFGSVFILSRWINQNRKIMLLTEDILNSTDLVSQNPNENTQDIRFIIYPVDGMPVAELPEPGGPNDYYDFADTNYMNINFSDLISKNTDTVGWIQVPGTKVNYPFVQAKDNAYYLKKAFNKKSNAGGWIFGDYRNDMNTLKKNTIIYGHNITNKTMFGSLPNVLNKNWQNKKDNHYIKMSTPSRNMIFKVFSTYMTDPITDYIRTTFANDQEYQEFLNTMKKRSNYDYKESLTTDDFVLTLSTCDSTGKKRIVVQAKLVGVENR